MTAEDEKLIEEARAVLNVDHARIDCPAGPVCCTCGLTGEMERLLTALADRLSALSPLQPARAFDRDHGGRLVREAWVRWALTQPSPKPTWLVPYDDLDEPDKEADRQIAEALFAAFRSPPQPAGEAGLAAHLPSQEWLSKKVATDPDVDCEASTPEPGFVVVPVEPTEAMLAATVNERGLPSILEHTTPEERGLPFLMPRYTWRAMLSAAPQPGGEGGADLVGRYITMSEAEAGIGNAVLNPEEPVDGCYWTLIGSGPLADQNRLGRQIVEAINRGLSAPSREGGEGIAEDKK